VAGAGTWLSEIATSKWERTWSTVRHQMETGVGCTLTEVMAGFDLEHTVRPRACWPERSPVGLPVCVLGPARSRPGSEHPSRCL
jgi:hypothetical protein